MRPKRRGKNACRSTRREIHLLPQKMPNRKHDSMIEKAYTVAQNDWIKIRSQTTSSASAAKPDSAIAIMAVPTTLRS
jgi:hypothetical protein